MQVVIEKADGSLFRAHIDDAVGITPAALRFMAEDEDAREAAQILRAEAEEAAAAWG